MKLAQYNDLGIRVGIGSDLAGGTYIKYVSEYDSCYTAGRNALYNHSYSRPVTASEAFLIVQQKQAEAFLGKKQEALRKVMILML